MQSVCDEAGLPVEPAKSVGPTLSLVFLGILIDSVKGELRLPQEKLLQLQSTIAQWRGRKACRKRELLSLIGSLSHACRVVRSGRVFLRRLIDLSTKANQLDHYIRLNAEAKADLEWWHHFITPMDPYYPHWQNRHRQRLSTRTPWAHGGAAQSVNRTGFSCSGIKYHRSTIFPSRN